MRNKYIYIVYIFAVMVFLLFETGCYHKMVVYEGIRMPSSQAIETVKQKARKELDAKNYEGAMQLYASIVDIDDTSEEAPAGLIRAGDIAFDIKLYNKAYTYYKEVLSRYPDTTYAIDARIGIGSIEMRTSDYAKAIDNFKFLTPLARGNKLGRVYFLLGESYYRLGKYPEAFDAIAHSIEYLSTNQEKELARLTLKEITYKNLSDIDIHILLNNHYGTYEEALLKLKLAQDMLETDNYQKVLTLVDEIIASGVASPDIMNRALSLKDEVTAITQVNMNNIGCILPLSGEFASYGKQVLNGIELALGIFSTTTSPYKLFIKDSGGIPEVAVKQAEELIKQDHVAAIIGPLLSSTSQEVAYKMQAYHVPMIYLNQRSSITRTGDYIFQNSLTPEDQTRELVNYAMQKLGISKFAVLYPMNAYGEDMMRAFVKQVLEHGGSITGMEGYYPTETDFKVQIKKLVGTYYLDLRKSDIAKLPPGQKDNVSPIIDFSAIFIPDNYEKVAMIAPQLLYYDVNNVQLLGGNGWSSEQLIQMGGRYVDGGIFTDGFFTESTNPATRAFIQSYEGLFHQEPTVLSALGYDSANILKLAMQNAQNRADIKDNILKIKDFNGVSGTISYNNNQVPVKTLYLLKVSGKKIIEISH
ncbi:MAG: penicillin-binding protein activator [bacterium]